MQTEAWESTVGEICDATQRLLPRRSYTARELESVELLRRVCGLHTSSAARDFLASDRGKHARLVLGFETERASNCSRPRVLLEGVPSDPTMSRYRAATDLDARCEAYERCFTALVDAHLPLAGPQLTHFWVDGTDMKTSYTCPKFDKKTGEIVNAASVTCPDGGYRGGRNAGHGWHFVAFGARGLPWGYEFDKIHIGEVGMGVAVLHDTWPRIRPHLAGSGAWAFNADGAFSSAEIRRDSQSMGLVPIIHHAGHGDGPGTEANVQRRNAMVLEVRGRYQGRWYANGHHELFCRCGEGATSKRIRLNRDGSVSISTEGACRQCGPVSITAGQYRRVANPDGFARIHPAETNEADWSFGNPFTFHDELAAVYGRKRFGHNEGMHGALQQRFGLLSEKRPYKRAAQARIEVAMVFSIVHVLAMSTISPDRS